MKAIVHDRYGPPGDVLSFDEVDDPSPRGGEVVVRTRAASLNPADWHLVRGEPYLARLKLGLRRPAVRQPGCDVAGTIEAIGAGVTTVRPGDDVVGCSFGRRHGAFAELVALPVDRLVRKPDGCGFEESAAVPLAAMTALQALRDHARVERGQRVMVVGASGGVGHFAVQLARWLGADVTAVCSRTNASFARSLGSSRTVDYESVDDTALDERFDVVVQLGGTASPGALRRIVAPSGIALVINGDSDGYWVGAIGRVLRAAALAPFVPQKLTTFTVAPNLDDLELLVRLLAEGALVPTISRTVALPDVPTALCELERGHTRGKVVVAV